MYSNSKEYEESRRLLVEAIASAKAKEFKSAKRILEKILRIPSTLEQTAEAHFWLSEISKGTEEKKEHLELAISINPTHHLARKKLAIVNGKLKESEIIDPDNISPEFPGGIIKSEGKRYVCRNCGGTLTYSPNGQNLVCEYCESQKRTALNGKVNETEFVIGISTKAGHKKAVSMQSFECNACHAIFLLQPETLTLTCPYCDSTYAINSFSTSQLIPPEGIIPFTIGRKETERILLDWLKKNKVKSKPYIEPFTGIYLPIWTFDISGHVKWTGYFSQNDIPSPVTGQKYVFFDDIMVPASIQCPYKYIEIISGYKSEDIIPYSHEYTVNWVTETYTITMADAAIDARSEAFKKAKRIHGNEEDLRNIIDLNFSSAGLFIQGFKLILAPVWLGEYVYSGQQYNVTINGKTAQIQGELPPTRLELFSDWLFKPKSN
jgi:DNA-directed RNA polymerase subunit RPC12/RpoP